MLRALLLFLASAVLLCAQSAGSATLVGTVTDSTGAAIPGAKVNVVNTATSFVSNSETGPEGNYYVPYLAPGSYQLTIEAGGFKRYVREGIVLRINEQPRIDVQLDVGNVTESIEVTGAPPLLETETSSTGQILEGNTIVKIPVLQKYAFRILLYLPSTSNINGQHVVGQRERSLGYTLDGVSGKEPVRAMIGSTNQVTSTPIDALEEAKLWTTGMPAEFGHSAGGLLSGVFKNGTNFFHGSAEDRYIQRVLIYRTRMEQLARKNPFSYHELSATASGPIYLPKIYNGKDKTFWLFGFQRHHEKGGETFTGAVPSADMLNGDFSFGGVGNPIYDPTTIRQDAASKWISDPFAGNRIPQSRFDTATKNFLSNNPYTPANAKGYVNATGIYENLTAPTKYRSWRTRYDAKIDHQFSSNNKMFGRYSHVRHLSWQDRYSPEIQWQLFDYRAVPIPIDQRNIVLSDTWTISPTAINEVRLGYNRRRYTQNSESVGDGWAQKLGIPNVGPATFPYFLGVSGAQFYRNGSLGFAQEVAEEITFQENLTKVLSKHTLKFGYELIRTRFNSLVEELPSGTYYMGGTQYPFAPSGTTGNDFASLLLGSVTRADFSLAAATWLPRWWSHAFYIQDDWKIRRNITLNLGLRWSYESPFSTKYGQQSQFDPTAKDPLTGRMGAIVHKGGSLSSRDLNNFQPRVGLAWNFNPKLVLRSSFGLITQDLMTNGTNQNFEEYFAAVSVQQPTGDPRIAFRLSQGPPPVRFPISPDGSVPYGGTNYSGRNASWFDPNMRMPYIMNWSTGLQYNFVESWLTEVTYQGSAGVRLLNNWDMNAIPLNISKDPAELERIRQSAQNYKPYPQFGAIQHFSNYGHNTYHGVTARVEKRSSFGYAMNTFYTFSKSLNDVDSDGGGSGITFYNRRLEKARANYDIRHRFVSVNTYELPVGKGRKFMNQGGILNGIFGGWQLAWIQTFQSGPPFSLSFGGSPYNYLPGVTRPNIVLPKDQAVFSGWDVGPNRFPTAAQNPYVNAAALAYPAAFTAGNMGRNVIEASGINWTQLSLSKEFPIWESVKFILRWDFNNAFKSPNYGQPASTYNTRDLNNFGRVGTATRGGFSDIGTANTNSLLVFLLEW